MSGKSISDKLWERHVVTGEEGESQFMYVDQHYIHEVTSPQALQGPRDTGRKVRRPDLTFGTTDHNVPTVDIFNIRDLVSKNQIGTLARNAEESGIDATTHGTKHQGIVHVVGPEIGRSQSGKFVICGDSHMVTHGALRAIASGIGISEVEHASATQCTWQVKLKKMKVEPVGKPQKSVYSKNFILALIAQYGVDAGVGYVVEYCGEVIDTLSMNERMTIADMSAELGVKMGLMNPDRRTFDYVKGREVAPKGDRFEQAVEDWKTLVSDPDAEYDKVITIDVSGLVLMVTWGTNSEMGVEFDKPFLEIKDMNDERAYHYMDTKSGDKAEDIDLGYVFIGSHTNVRLSDLELAAKIVKGKHISPNLTAIVVPGSRPVKKEAEQLGLDKISMDADFEQREPGCSMCFGMNPDHVLEGVHCASISNRNFEGRQGFGACTHLCSPAMAAAAAVVGKFIDVRQLSEVQ